MDKHNWGQLTSQQTLAAMAQAAMEKSPASREKIAEVFQVLSSTLSNHERSTKNEQCGTLDFPLETSQADIEASAAYEYFFEQSPHSMIVTDLMGCIRDLNSAAIVLFAPQSQDISVARDAETKSLVPLLKPFATTNRLDSLHRNNSQEDKGQEDKGQEVRSALVQESLLSFISPESSQHFLQYLVRVTQGHSPSPLKLWVQTLTGEQRWVQVAANPLFAHQSPSADKARDDEPHSIIWVIIDITDALQTELALKQQINQVHQSYTNIQQVNQELAEAVQTKNSQVLKATEFESALKRITDKVRDSLDESKILQTVVKELSIVLRLGGCNTALYDLEKGTSTISYEYTNFISAYRGKVAQMDHFPEIYNQLKHGYYFQFCSLIPNPERGHVSLLACPIFVDSESDVSPHPSSASTLGTVSGAVSGAVSGEQVLGDLWLIDRKEHVFNEFEIRLVQQVANQCAIAIRQARLYKAAQAQVHELEKLNRLKDEFLSTVSHELRTPISNVKMAIHMLKNAPTEEKRQQYIKILEAESQREADLINDLLDLQKLEVSTHSISAHTLQVQPWLAKVTQPFHTRMESHHQEMVIECANDVRALRTDFSVLERIVAELLNNACKYTPSGHKIQVTVCTAQALQPLPGSGLTPSDTLAPGSNQLYQNSEPGSKLDPLAQSSNAQATKHREIVLTISNQAEIAEDELAHIFDKFYRVPHSDPWKRGGTGLGLALVQKLVKQLHGTIEVSSDQGWTHFTVTLSDQP